MNPVLQVQAAWQLAAREIGFEFVCPFSLGTGIDHVQFHGLVVGFGSPKGTAFLASTDFKEDVGTAARMAAANGYFFSCISAVGYGTFDRASFIETLKDWGWHSKDLVPPQGFARPIPTEKKKSRSRASQTSRL